MPPPSPVSLPVSSPSVVPAAAGPARAIAARPARGRSHRPASRGLTLVEFMIVLAIAAILLAAGLPSLGRTVQAAAVAAASREFCAALRQARAQALRRGGRVTVCARAPRVEPPACAAALVPGWAAGWLVFSDDGAAGQPDGADALLRLQGATPHVPAVEASLASVSFSAAGLSLDAASHFLFRAQDPAVSQLVCVSKSGRPRLAPAGRVACTGNAG